MPRGAAADTLFELRRRTFDTPHFAGIEFIEVEAKSIINHVPGDSVPFSWTINPYRGCSHSCSYCLVGETPILMSDGRTKPLADVRVGDEVYGTQRVGRYRRFTTSPVLDHWSTVKPAYRVVLEDGTELVASGDHRFLTDRGWKHVTGGWGGPLQRPHLTTNNSLLGVGGLAAGPVHDDDYRTGYLCGIIRGDGSLGSYRYASGVVHRFRLALKDLEALRRAKDYLAQREIETQRFLFQAASGTRAEIQAIRTSARGKVDAIRESIAWRARPGESWTKGFLAGVFDAEGSYSNGILRITNGAPEILRRIETCARALGFVPVLEPPRPNGVRTVRIRGGVREALRFFHTVDPAITRKRSIDGQAIKNDVPLGVRSVEALGIELPMFDITTGTGDFIANGVVSHNCFARPTHTYMDMNAGRDFETKIVVKVNAPELLHRELRKKRWTGDHIAMGTATDPYQRAEGRYKLMPRIISELVEMRNPFSILTKGTLILRDLELLREAASVVEISTALSVPTLDDDVWRRSEPGTPHPRKRLEAVAKLNAAGIPCGVMVAPVLPGISDRQAQLHTVVKAAVDAGATFVTPILLHLRPVVREHFLGWLGEHYPELSGRYADLYRRSSYAPTGHRKALGAKVASLVRSAGGLRPSPERSWRRPKQAGAAEQLTLL